MDTGDQIGATLNAGVGVDNATFCERWIGRAGLAEPIAGRYQIIVGLGVDLGAGVIGEAKQGSGLSVVVELHRVDGTKAVVGADQHPRH